MWNTRGTSGGHWVCWPAVSILSCFKCHVTNRYIAKCEYVSKTRHLPWLLLGYLNARHKKLSPHLPPPTEQVPLCCHRGWRTLRPRSNHVGVQPRKKRSPSQ